MFGFNLVKLLETAGYIGLFAIIFAESGLFIGFFLPGDSLLFTAGFLASLGYFNIQVLILLTFAGAVLGDSFGYFFGRRIGPRIFNKEDSLLFNKEHLERAQNYYDSHGPKTIVLARFLPVIRTFVPILAGVGKMHYETFLAYNVLGAVIWAAGIPALGFYLGSTVPSIDVYLWPIIFAIVIITSLPTLIHIFRDPSDRAQIFGSLKKLWRYIAS